MNINSPVTESELKAKAVDLRVTDEELNSAIVVVNFFTAANGIRSAYTAAGPVHPSHSLLTFCVIVLKNGFTVTGESACASPENYNEEIGQRIAFANAKAKIWPLMGYELRSKLAARG